MASYYDCHMHTSFSGDCSVPLEEMIAAGKAAGLAGITITDHLDWDYRENPGRFDLDLPAYAKKIKTRKKESSGTDFPVLFGLELGLQQHLIPRHEKLLSEYDFDYVIGSIHVVGGADPYYPGFYENRPVLEAYREYFTELYENLRAFPKVDALGHLDYIRRYATANLGPEGDLPYDQLSDLIDAILLFLIEKDISLEVNTGAFRCGLSEPNPSYRILNRYYKLGGRAITLGADAHRTEHVGLAFSSVLPRLRDIGFTSYRIYQNRTPVELPL